MDYRFAFLLLAVQILSIWSQGEAQFEPPPYGYGGGPYQPPEEGYIHPYANGTRPKVNCSELICGEGTCNSSYTSSQNGSSWSYSYSYNYSGSLCKCKPEWMPYFHDSPFSPNPYRPCVIPNCTFTTIADKCNFTLPNRQPPDGSNATALLDPCAWTDCGMGTCEAASEFRYECRCQEGFKNLFNNSAFPCMNECMITDECAEKTGATFLAKSTAGGVGAGGGGANGAANVPGKKLLGLLLTMMCVAMAWG